MEILNTLEPSARPDFEFAWNKGYKKFITTLKEAAGKLQEYLEEAKMEATGMLPKKKAGKGVDKKSQSATLRHSREKNLG